MIDSIKFKSLMKESFDKGTENYIPLVLNGIFYGVIGLLLMFSKIGIIIYPALVCSVLLYHLKCARGEKISIPDSLYDGFKKNRWWKLTLFAIVWYIALFFGTLLLILPGIYLLLTSIFSFIYLVEEPNDSKNACKKSRNLFNKLGFWKTSFLLLPYFIIMFVLGVLPILLFGYEFVIQNQLTYQIIAILFGSVTYPFFISYIPLIYLKVKDL